MRSVVRISLTDAWRWYHEDWDLAGNQVLETSTTYPTWQAARDAGIAAHPDAEVSLHVVADTGVRFEDGMPIGVMA